MVGKSTPVVDVETPAVCLDIQLDLQDYGRFSHGQLVVPQPLPDQTCLVSDYLGVVMPNVRIECLGRPSMLQLRREYEQLGPTSLFFDTVHHCFQRQCQHPAGLTQHDIGIPIHSQPKRSVDAHCYLHRKYSRPCR